MSRGYHVVGPFPLVGCPPAALRVEAKVFPEAYQNATLLFILPSSHFHPSRVLSPPSDAGSLPQPGYLHLSELPSPVPISPMGL